MQQVGVEPHGGGEAGAAGQGTAVLQLDHGPAIEDEALADSLRKLSATFGVGVTSFGLTAEALEDLPRPANILNAHPRETEAIMGKLDINRLAAPRSRAQLDWNELGSLRNESEEAEKLVLWLTRRAKLGRGLLVAGTVLLLTFSNKFVSVQLVRPIEARLSLPDASRPTPSWTVLEKLSTTVN